MARHIAAVEISPAQTEARSDEGDVGNGYSTCHYDRSNLTFYSQRTAKMRRLLGC